MGASKPTTKEPIAAALFGAGRQSVLRLLYGHPDERFYQRQVVHAMALGYGAVQRELARLSRCGILTRAVEGRQTYYQANRDCPVFEELRGLIRKTFGVADVLQGGLGALADRIRLAFIYGSIAKGGETAESDVDVMVVGDELQLGDLVSALSGAQGELRREVNPSLYRTEEFCRKLKAGHHFVTEVVAGPKIFLIGDDRELARLAEIRVAEAPSHKPAGGRRPVRHRGS
ncbi:MAG: ArsR family transcriptional regulator [Planctomycetes bacterium]|nr:ArsR family transcriptional regulator [Planctomycetota bacterium]